MRIEVQKEKTFIPKWNGNDKDPEPIKVHHRFLKPSERKQFIRLEPFSIEYEKDEQKTSSQYIQDSEGIAKAVIQKIENLTLVIDGKDKKIDTVDKMYNVEGVPQGLVAEIEAYLLNASPEVDGDFLG